MAAVKFELSPCRIVKLSGRSTRCSEIDGVVVVVVGTLCIGETEAHPLQRDKKRRVGSAIESVGRRQAVVARCERIGWGDLAANRAMAGGCTEVWPRIIDVHLYLSALIQCTHG
jgi:hypothetical protein